jgi:hypothetical protein
MGLGDALERPRRESRDAGTRHLLRSAAERCREIPDRRDGWLRRRTPFAGSHHSETRAASPVSAEPSGTAAPRGSFDAHAATRGKALFEGKADCARCHVPPLYTEPGWNMHRPEEIGIDGFQAERSPDEHYRTAPLKGLWTHAKGGFYHDGRFATLADVVAHYDRFFSLGLSGAEKRDLVEYLKSL